MRKAQYDSLISWFDININELQKSIGQESNKVNSDKDDLSFMEGQKYALRLAKSHFIDSCTIWQSVMDE